MPGVVAPTSIPPLGQPKPAGYYEFEANRGYIVSFWPSLTTE